jgi:hypothetical protein
VTTTFTTQNQDQPAPPQWLVSAFLVLLGVAILGAIPASSGAASGSTAAANEARGLAERIVVRAKIQIRVLPSQPAATPDTALVSAETAPVFLLSDRIAPQAQDAGARIAQRGIKIRAPPANLA